MIKVNLTELKEEGKKFINMLTDNKGQELRLEMIKFLKEEYWPDSFEYGLILEYINDFFFAFQPERLSEKIFEELESLEESDSLNNGESH